MHPRDVWDFRRVILKYRRASALNSKDPGTSIDIPRAEALGGKFGVPNISKSLVSIEERARTFLRAIGDHQACGIEPEEHGCGAFEFVIEVWRWFCYSTLSPLLFCFVLPFFFLIWYHSNLA